MLLCNDSQLVISLCIYTDNDVCDTHVIFSHTSHMLVIVGRFRLNSLIIVITLVIYKLI
jgi:hypothetical protein